MKRLTAVAILLAVVVASCGGGNTDIEGNESTADSPEDAVAEERAEELAKLRELAEEFHERFPGVPRWQHPWKPIEGESNGTERLVSVGKTVSGWGDELLTGEPVAEWKLLRYLGVRGAERRLEGKTPDVDAVRKALKESAYLANEMKSISRFDAVALMASIEDRAAYLAPLTALERSLRRFELLMYAGMEEHAKRELTDWVEVLLKVDAIRSATIQLLHSALIRGAIYLLADASCSSILRDEEFHAGFSRLRDDPVESFWSTFRNDLAWCSAVYLGEVDNEHLQEVDPSDLRAWQRDTRGRMQLAQRFGNVGLNPLENDVYAAMRLDYLKIADRESLVAIGNQVMWAVVTQGFWLAYDLVRMDLQQPLYGRIDVIQQMAAEVPGVIVAVDESTGSVEVKIDPEHLLLKDDSLFEDHPLIEFDLRKPEPEEED